MVNLRHLNDGELNHNLRQRFGTDTCYGYCGNTCVAINLFYRGKGYPEELKKALHVSKAAWEVNILLTSRILNRTIHLSILTLT